MSWQNAPLKSSDSFNQRRRRKHQPDRRGAEDDPQRVRASTAGCGPARQPSYPAGSISRRRCLETGRGIVYLSRGVGVEISFPGGAASHGSLDPQIHLWQSLPKRKRAVLHVPNILKPCLNSGQRYGGPAQDCTLSAALASPTAVQPSTIPARGTSACRKHPARRSREEQSSLTSHREGQRR